MCWCWSINTAIIYAASNVFTRDLCFFCCVCFETYSVVQRYSRGKLRPQITLLLPFVVQRFIDRWLENNKNWQWFAWQYKRKTRSWCRKNPKHRLKYDSSVYLPDFLYISSFRIFSPLCCCSRVRPVEFFLIFLSLA